MCAVATYWNYPITNSEPSDPIHRAEARTMRCAIGARWFGCSSESSIRIAIYGLSEIKMLRR